MAVGDTCHTTLVRLWNRVLDLMQVQTSRHEFNTWVRRTALLSIANGVATIGTPSAFFKEGFEHRYIGAVRDLISDLYIPIKQVRVVITEESDCNRPGALSPQYHRRVPMSHRSGSIDSDEQGAQDLTISRQLCCT